MLRPGLRAVSGLSKRKFLPTLLTLALLAGGMCGQLAAAQWLGRETVSVSPLCQSARQAVALSARQAPSLLGLPVQRIALYRWSGSRLEPVIFQLDRKDNDDRYILANGIESEEVRLDENDELVFLLADAAGKIPDKNKLPAQNRLLEIRLDNTLTGSSRWVYVRLFNSPIKSSGKQYVEYLPEQDLIRTGLYQAGFSHQLPFLMDSFSWHDPLTGNWYPDLIDTMKIRHQGKLFGLIRFSRSHADYTSKLVAVKKGPVRVIRRTENRVHVFLNVKSPALFIDYVMSPGGFQMDMVVDIPFTMGLFFSDVQTLTTVDWRPVETVQLLIESPKLSHALTVDGRMNADKQRFNEIDANRFSVRSAQGSMQVQLDIPEDFPIRARLYLKDDISEPDLPENDRGQYGNVGFRTLGWEKIDSEVHHLKFTVCMSPGR